MTVLPTFFVNLISLDLAENKRKRLAAIKAGKNISGKDYDHKDKKFKSVKANRGNDGKGTKKE